MMYEYAPKMIKKTEVRLLLATLLPAVLLFGISKIPNVAFPAIYQLTSVILLVATVMITTRYLMRRYVYRIEARADQPEGTPPDFTVTEYYGSRITVVCRVSVTDVESVTPVTAENRKQIAALEKGIRTYHYTDTISPTNLYQLGIRDGEELYYVRILADEKLLSFFEQPINSNKCLI